MKNYQKPMVNVEMINVEDVITASTVIADDFSSTDKTWTTNLGTSGMTGNDGTIVFEW